MWSSTHTYIGAVGKTVWRTLGCAVPYTILLCSAHFTRVVELCGVSYTRTCTVYTIRVCILSHTDRNGLIITGVFSYNKQRRKSTSQGLVYLNHELLHCSWLEHHWTTFRRSFDHLGPLLLRVLSETLHSGGEREREREREEGRVGKRMRDRRYIHVHQLMCVAHYIHCTCS